MKKIQGTPAACGYGSGLLAVSRTIQEERQRNLEEAREDCIAHIHEILENATSQPDESKEILEVYEMLLLDSNIQNAIHRRTEEGEELLTAIEVEYEQAASLFERMENSYMRQRAEDVRAVKAMLLRSASGERKEIPYTEGAEHIILAARELSPTDIMELPRNQLAGLLLEKGGLTSHTVILAKAMGIPVVVGVAAADVQNCGIQVLLDGQTGLVILDPDAETAEEFRKQESAYGVLLEMAASMADKPAVTKDNCPVKLCINAGSYSDFEKAGFGSWDGIGLLRTEFLYTDRKTMPSLKEQRIYFQKAFAFAAGRPVTVRTLDIGGDKEVSYLPLLKEENPFLGNRGIRFCLRNTELFCTQIRALLEAAKGAPFSLMFPMISIAEEFFQARELFLEVKEQVKREGCPVSEEIRLGIMVETPAAAVMADEFAHHVDFMSIGTNDLTQYVMAADRGNAAVNDLYNVCQPAVLRMIQMTVRACKEQKIEVSVCGEAAADSKCLPILISMGIRKLSVSSTQVGLVKYRLGCINAENQP